MGKILRISLKLNFTPNNLGGYGLNRLIKVIQTRSTRLRLDFRLVLVKTVWIG